MGVVIFCRHSHAHAHFWTLLHQRSKAWFYKWNKMWCYSGVCQVHLANEEILTQPDYTSMVMLYPSPMGMVYSINCPMHLPPNWRLILKDMGFIFSYNHFILHQNWKYFCLSQGSPPGIDSTGKHLVVFIHWICVCGLPSYPFDLKQEILYLHFIVNVEDGQSAFSCSAV